ncbi:MAG: class III lanthionine synthetase LanKC [Gemmatimonadota bacterium]
MDKRYELYCLTDRRFYDSPDGAVARDADFRVSSRSLPPGWERVHWDEWLIHQPPGTAIPPQGWKIHVSACGHNADDVLAEVWDYCVPRNISFKYLRSRRTLHMRNAKYAPREASGKLVTIYPLDGQQFGLILRELGALLSGQPGPYILSDLRYGAGPLFVRYGGFTRRHCANSKGELVPAIEDGSGRLVPDERRPVFSVPEWAALPACLEPHLAARNAVSLAAMPYQITRALHFSNGGGVYVATDMRTGEQVVLKEARPYAGLDATGADAVERLRREHDILAHLAGLAVVPEARDYFELGEHHFLVLSYIDGQPLNSFFAHRHPLSGPQADPADVASYTEWALAICQRAEEAVAAIHARGVIINDLHMFNIMVRPDGSVALLDFEVAALASEHRRPTIGNPGFVAPRDRTGYAIDRYSLACLRLAMFIPLTTLFPLAPGKAAELAEAAAAHFPVPRSFLDEAVREITGPAARPRPGRAPRFEPTAAGLRRASSALTRAIMASATPERPDRLFPGDIHQFAGPGGGLNLAYGTAGVLYALHQAGQRVLPEHGEWLISRATQPERGTRTGLYSGLLGIACVLERLGHPEAALKIAGICLGEKWEQLGSDLHDGLSGIGLAFQHLADTLGDPALRDAADRALGIVAGRDPRRPEGVRAGLMRGASGPALLFVRAYERTGDAGYLDLAAAALHSELDGCVASVSGALQVDEGWRVLPYLGHGSAGIGMVIDDYLAHRPDERLAAAVPGIRLAASSQLYAQSGLFSGRAGLILYLARQRPDDPVAAAHVRRLAWHAIGYQRGVAFPGDQLFRLSMDLATGTAGVLLGLAALAGHGLPGLPFLGEPAGRSTAGPQASDQPHHGLALDGPEPGLLQRRGNRGGGDKNGPSGHPGAGAR